MFDWLANEIATIKTRKFHIVDGPAAADLRRAIQTTKLAAPRSFKEFALRFGNAQLYRHDEIDLHSVRVYASMKATSTGQGEPLFEIGKYEDHFAYFKADLLSGEKESPVFEWIMPTGYLRKAADGFEAWLTRRCQAARKQYSKRRWAEIVAGPQPLTAEERAMLAARKKFKWKVVGIAKNGDVKFQVTNASKLVLPYLSIGLRGKTIGEGGAFLPVGSIRPGQTKIVQFDCYKDVEPPDEIVAFAITDLGPEDRNHYWEFQHLPKVPKS
jgi:hypothetical protein